jgi:hypothetical protein
LPEKFAQVPDAANVWRKLPYALLLTSLLVFGFFPRLLSDKITPDAKKITDLVAPAPTAQARPIRVEIAQVSQSAVQN